MENLKQHFDSNNSSQDLPEGFIINSVQLCEIINQFREEEGKKTVLLHKNFKASIETELEALKKVGIRDELNFQPIYYIDNQNRKQPCFAMTKAGAMQMLNKESAVVRWKTQEYIEALEYRITQLDASYTETLNDRFLNGFNYKEIIDYLSDDSINDLQEIKDLNIFKLIKQYPYAAFIKPYFECEDSKLLENALKNNELKKQGVKTFNTKEFTDLLDKHNVEYRDESGFIFVNGYKIRKGSIKMLSEKALVYLALILKKSETAKNYRHYLLEDETVVPQAINELTTEKDIIQATQLVKFLEKEKELFYKDKEQFLNDKEEFYKDKKQLEKDKEQFNKDKEQFNKDKEQFNNKKSNKIKKTFDNFIKKFNQIFNGGDSQSKTIIEESETNIIESETNEIIDDLVDYIILHDEENKENDKNQKVYEEGEYEPPSSTRQPIATNQPRWEKVSKEASNEISKDVIGEFKRIAKRLNIDNVYNSWQAAYKAIDKEFGTNIASTPRHKLKKKKYNYYTEEQLKYGIQYLKNVEYERKLKFATNK